MLNQPRNRDPANEAVRLMNAAPAIVLKRKCKGVGDVGSRRGVDPKDGIDLSHALDRVRYLIEPRKGPLPA
jgi:hypothetical protein